MKVRLGIAPIASRSDNLAALSDEAVQSHTNYDPGHTPPLTPALWAEVRPR